MTISCQQVTEWSSEYLDGDLDGVHAEQLNEHVAGCDRCQEGLASLRTMVRAMGDPDLFAMPTGMHERLSHALESGRHTEAAAAGAPARVARWNWLRGGKDSYVRRRMAWAVAIVVVVFGIGVFRSQAGAITTSGWLIDTHCLSTYRDKLAQHPSECILKCAQQHAVGVVNAQGEFMRFDARGRRKVLAEVQATRRPDHLWVTVRGRRAGNKQTPVLDVEQVEITAPGTTAFSLP